MITFTLKSKTHIFGALIGIFGGLAAFLPVVKDMIPPNWYPLLFIGTSVVVIILRNVTTQAITDK